MIVFAGVPQIHHSTNRKANGVQTRVERKLKVRMIVEPITAVDRLGIYWLSTVSAKLGKAISWSWDYFLKILFIQIRSPDPPPPQSNIWILEPNKICQISSSRMPCCLFNQNSVPPNCPSRHSLNGNYIVIAVVLIMIMLVITIIKTRIVGFYKTLIFL